jgi:DNA-binding winged helix-turn-helix (wHTH) protein
LSSADSPVFLTPKAFDVLTFLVQNPNRLVTKEELLQAVWGDTFVEEGNLTQYISHLRKALGDNSDDARLIVTITRKGYQFTADVTVGEAADIATPYIGSPRKHRAIGEHGRSRHWREDQRWQTDGRLGSKVPSANEICQVRLEERSPPAEGNRRNSN